MAVQKGGEESFKKSGRPVKNGFWVSCSSTQKQPLAKQAEGGAGLVRYIDRAAKDGEGCAGRIFFQQENPVGRYAERAGRARHAGTPLT